MEPVDIPPCPQRLLEAVAREPAPPLPTVEEEPRPGAVWEVILPGGEQHLFLVTESVKKGEGSPFAFVRAMPLTDYIRLAADGDVIVTAEPGPEVLVSHCWLEGPILATSLRRCCGHVLQEDLESALRERRRDTSPWAIPDETIGAFRRSLYDQIEPIYTVCWDEVYRVCAAEAPAPVADTDMSAVAGQVPRVSPPPSRADVAGADEGTSRSARKPSSHLSWTRRFTDFVERVRSWRRWQPLPLAVAACLLVAVGLGLWIRQATPSKIPKANLELVTLQEPGMGEYPFPGSQSTFPQNSRVTLASPSGGYRYVIYFNDNGASTASELTSNQERIDWTLTGNGMDGAILLTSTRPLGNLEVIAQRIEAVVAGASLERGTRIFFGDSGPRVENLRTMGDTQPSGDVPVWTTKVTEILSEVEGISYQGYALDIDEE